MAVKLPEPGSRESDKRRQRSCLSKGEEKHENEGCKTALVKKARISIIKKEASLPEPGRKGELFKQKQRMSLIEREDYQKKTKQLAACCSRKSSRETKDGKLSEYKK